MLKLKRGKELLLSVLSITLLLPASVCALELQTKISHPSVRAVTIDLHCRWKKESYKEKDPYRVFGLYVPSLTYDEGIKKNRNIGPCKITFTVLCNDNSECGSCTNNFESVDYKNVVLENKGGNPDSFTGDLTCRGYNHWLP